VHSVPDRLVDHVQGNDHRSAQLQELQRQFQGPFEPAGINDIDDQIPGLFQDILDCNPDLWRGSPQGIHSRKINNLDLPAVNHRSAQEVIDRRSREICRRRPVTGHRVENRAFSAVRLPGEKELHGLEE